MAESNDFLKLESALLRAGREMEFPATPAIAARVRAELAASPRTLRNAPPERAPERSWWRVLVPLAAAVILALALLFAFPTAREAIGQFLGLRGLQIFYVTPTRTPTVPPTETPRPTTAALVPTGPNAAATPTPRATITRLPSPTPTGKPFEVCCEVTLAEAKKLAKFEFVVPPGEAPSRVYYQRFFDDGEQVVMLFGNPNNPRMTLYQAQQWVYGKLLGKMLPVETVLSETMVNGERALWFSGAPHVLVVLDANGMPNYETQRTVNANTLVWEWGNGERDIIYRLETKGTMEQAVEFAESLRKAP